MTPCAVVTPGSRIRPRLVVEAPLFGRLLLLPLLFALPKILLACRAAFCASSLSFRSFRSAFLAAIRILLAAVASSRSCLLAARSRARSAF